MGLRNVFLISKEFWVNLFVCSFTVFSDKCLFFALVLICLVVFSFISNKLFPLSALALPAKQAVLKSSFQKIRHQSPTIFTCFFWYLFSSQSTLPQLGQPELQREMQSLLPGHLTLFYLLLLNYSDLVKPRREKKGDHLRGHP